MRWNLEKSKDFEIDELHLHAYQIYFDPVTKTHVHTYRVYAAHITITTNCTLFASIEESPPASIICNALFVFAFCIWPEFHYRTPIHSGNGTKRQKLSLSLCTQFAFINNNQCSREENFTVLCVWAIPLKVMRFNLPKSIFFLLFFGFCYFFLLFLFRWVENICAERGYDHVVCSTLCCALCAYNGGTQLPRSKWFLSNKQVYLAT